MLRLGLILISTVLISASELTINDYIVKIDNDTLTSIESTGKSSDVLNLSNLGLRSLDINAFDNVTNLKRLELANNSLTALPEFVFQKLTNLEHLSLSNNQIRRLKNVVVGLSGLKFLDISKNDLQYLDPDYFRLLDKDCVIFMRGNPISNNNPLWNFDPDYFNSQVFNHTAVWQEYQKHKNGGAIICIRNGIVSRVDYFDENDVLDKDCTQVELTKISDESLKINLRKLGISNFDKGWYRIYDIPIEIIDLEGNNITRLTDVLTWVPINGLNLRGNKIERLERGDLTKATVDFIDLSNNNIHHIDEDALAKTTVETLILNGNRLKNTKFLATLPKSITSVSLNDNDITEITRGSFENVHHDLKHLELSGNKITEFKSDWLRGQTLLITLKLSKNGIKKIEPGSFADLLMLKELDLSNNDIVSFDNQVFAGLAEIKTLNISGNRLTKIDREWLNDLPNTLLDLDLSDNEIETLHAGTFVNVPKTYLSLKNNKIRTIERGSFNLPTLIDLTLENNLLSELNNESFEGLPELLRLSVESNRITKVNNGAVKHLPVLELLQLTKNPLEKLENGALRGLVKRNNLVLLDDVPLKSIQAAVFNEI